jgi:hypothetical protein
MLGILQNLRHSPTMLANTKYDVATYMTTCSNFVLRKCVNQLNIKSLKNLDFKLKNVVLLNNP